MIRFRLVRSPATAHFARTSALVSVTVDLRIETVLQPIHIFAKMDSRTPLFCRSHRGRSSGTARESRSSAAISAEIGLDLAGPTAALCEDLPDVEGAARKV